MFLVINNVNKSGRYFHQEVPGEDYVLNPS